MVDKRKNKRYILNKPVRVKEDNGELIKYYNIENISVNGMFLNKKIKDANESTALYTIMISEDKNIKVKGQILGTRKNNEYYGTAISFDESISYDLISKLI